MSFILVPSLSFRQNLQLSEKVERKDYKTKENKMAFCLSLFILDVAYQDTNDIYVHNDIYSFLCFYSIDFKYYCINYYIFSRS